ncbi:MAG: ABC transporter substrate-binding protein [Acidobacteriia bacterium]|nr:ABC transporter substrate-binding protein [Terriglobia bacterium]
MYRESLARAGLVPALRRPSAGTPIRLLASIAGALLAASCGSRPASPTAVKLRLGHFPNVTHAQVLYGRATGSFEKAVGAPIAWTQFNAGPSAVEALFAGAVDASYVGPNPAINGFIKSQGRSFVIVAGAASGGAALVVRADAGITSESDFHGKTVATPQLANTQDVAARLWFADHGYTTREKGGDLTILPLANPDQLLMFQKRQIDAAWTVEPWVSRLEQEGHGRVFLEENRLWPDGKYVTALLVVRREFLAAHRDLVVRLLTAHVEATLTINGGKDAAVPLLAAEIRRETAKALPEAIVRSSLARIELGWDPLPTALAKSADDAHRIGFLHDRPNLNGIVEAGPLNEVLAARGLPPVAAGAAR